MFKEVDVIFFVEHKDRELESVKLIAERLKVVYIEQKHLFFHT